LHRSSSTAIDVQTVGIGAKERIDAIAMRGWIQTYRPDHAAIERAQSKARAPVSNTVVPLEQSRPQSFAAKSR